MIPPPGPHGGDGARVAAALGIPSDQILDLSQSLNPVAPDLRPVLRSHLDAIRRYPDAAAATAALAGCLGVDPSRVVLTNGGSEAISLVAAEVGGHVEEPEFSLHPRGGGPRWRSNPHNPTGRLARPDEVAGVWDEAFWQLASGSWTRGDADAGSWVVGSLTKLLACPGLRVGYVVAPDASGAARIVGRQQQWAVNGLVTEALPELLELVDLPGWCHRVASLRARLATLLTSVGLHVEPGSDACWLLVEAPGLRRRLAPHGIVVRDCGTFGLPRHARIAVPDDAGLARLEEALRR